MLLLFEEVDHNSKCVFPYYQRKCHKVMRHDVGVPSSHFVKGFAKPSRLETGRLARALRPPIFHPVFLILYGQVIGKSH